MTTDSEIKLCNCGMCSVKEGDICTNCGTEMKSRTLKQNRLMWAMLRDISKQMTWHGKWYEDKEWKDLFSALVQNQELVPSLDGKGVVMIGVSTRKQTSQWFSSMIMHMQVFGAEYGVRFRASQADIDFYRSLQPDRDYYRSERA
jgi:hypothetical protein